MNLKRSILLLAILAVALYGCDPPTLEPDPHRPGGDGREIPSLGTNWTARHIANDAVYHAFAGMDEISGQYQEVFAVDVDLNKGLHQVALVYEKPMVTTSAAFLKHNAITAINASYESSSIYLRMNGEEVFGLQNEVINGTTVPNWKSEAAFCLTAAGNPKILFAGSQKKGEVTVPQQREYYRNLSATEYPNFISSAPLLIDNFNPVGEDFCDYTIPLTQVNKLSGEDPERHQRVAHPRSAVALTANNHLILLVVDGRQKSAGMNARELTRFLVTWFNPQYALNLDGGGSSTLCVKGEGDPVTHVVNYPTDNSKYDHAGERVRDAFIVVR